MRIPASTLRPAWRAVLCLAALLTLFLSSARAQLPGISDARHDTWMQQVHAIGLLLFSYATDHDGSLPPGKSSTEVFQNLIAGGYVNDPKIFFLPMPGKVSPSSMTLKPENVCFDVTAGVDGNSPDTLPMVFSTGYKITYAAGGSAVPLAKSTPRGIAVAYRATDSSKYMVSTDPAGSVANVVPPTFDAQGKTYQQLTPDGPVP